LEILFLLIEHKGEIVGRDQIVSRIWGPGVFLDTDNSIRGAVNKLRQVLKDDADIPRFIQTVTGQGYRFIAPVMNAENLVGAAASEHDASALMGNNHSLASELDDWLQARRLQVVDAAPDHDDTGIKAGTVMEPICDREDVLLALERVLASPGLARNERMSRFLRVLVVRTLDGKATELKESVIGVEVFGRRPDYDPKVDSIVRTEAARLRTRLVEYYAADGRTDPVAIDVPKGAYVPVFVRHAVTTGPATAAIRRRWPLVVGIACGILVIAGVLAWALLRVTPPVRVAVLPLIDHSDHSRNPSDDVFADALTDEIIHNLSVIEGLEVRSRTSSFLLKDRPRDVRTFAQQLQVDYFIEGSVLRDGDRLRVDTQLIRARDDVSLWSGSFDRHVADVFAIQDEISLAIVNNLRLRLGRGRRRYETSVEAYNLYLRGSMLSSPIHMPNREWRPEERPAERHRASIQAFEEAIAIDRTFAPAYAGLARVYALRSVQFPEEHPADELSKMQAAADKAVALDQLLPDAHHALAMVQARLGEWDAAERSFQRAIELDPNRSSFRSDYAYWFLAVLGRHDEALAQLRAAMRADPLSTDLVYLNALVLVSAGRYGEAAAYCGRLQDDGLCMSRVRTGEGRLNETVRLLAHHAELAQNPQTRGFFEFALARTGRRDEAERGAAGSRFANEQTLIFAGMGDKERTYAALKEMSALGAQRVGLYLNYPELALLRNDEHLTAFRRSVGLLP
jgi:serine/threonine-protein kinase